MARRRVTDLKELVREALLAIPGVEESASAFTDAPAFWVNGKEVAHFDADGALDRSGRAERSEATGRSPRRGRVSYTTACLDLRLTRKVISAHRARLKADARVTFRRSGGDWLEVRVASAEDVAFAAELAELAAAAHRAEPGSAAKPPPAGPELERRRRFH